MAEIKKICEQDGTPFIATRVTAKYCSDKCRVAAGRGIKPSIESFGEAAFVNPEAISNIEIPKGVVVQHTHAVPVINNRAKISSAELMERMNERLAAKGLPLLQEELPPTEFVRTGLQEIDELTAQSDALGWGGLPRGHITEIFGTKGAGKTSLETDH